MRSFRRRSNPTRIIHFFAVAGELAVEAGTGSEAVAGFPESLF